MPVILQPIPGQPGLFRETLGELGATRYGGTQTFKRTRRRSLESLEATRYGGTQTFVRAQHPLNGVTEITQEATVIGRGADIVVTQEPNLTGELQVAYTTYVVVWDKMFSKDFLDSIFATHLAGIGFKTSPSEVVTSPIAMSWEVVSSIGGVPLKQNKWQARLAVGPKELLGKIFNVVDGTPTPQDNKDLPTAVQKYTFIAYPSSNKINTQTLIDTTFDVHAKLSVVEPLSQTFSFLNIQKKPFNWLLWLGVLGAGAAGALAYRYR